MATIYKEIRIGFDKASINDAVVVVTINNHPMPVVGRIRLVKNFNGDTVEVFYMYNADAVITSVWYNYEKVDTLVAV